MYHRWYSKLLYFLFVFLIEYIETVKEAKDNGDIYIVKEDQFIKDIKEQMQTESSLITDNNNSSMSITTTTAGAIASNLVNFDELVTICNSSFSIPMHYYTVFNTTASLPDLVDKTGMCFIRCLFEKAGFIEDWKLNAKKIRANMWPAMGDTMEVCQREGYNETNACVRAFAMAKCLQTRLLVDAPSSR